MLAPVSSEITEWYCSAILNAVATVDQSNTALRAKMSARVSEFFCRKCPQRGRPDAEDDARPRGVGQAPARSKAGAVLVYVFCVLFKGFFKVLLRLLKGSS